MLKINSFWGAARKSLKSATPTDTGAASAAK